MTQPDAPAQFDIGEDLPENGVAEVRAVREEREEPKPRKDKGKTHAAPRPIGAPPRSFEEANAHDRGKDGKPSEKDDWPRKAGPLWLQILEWLPSQKIGEETATPEDVGIGVERVSGGGQTGGATLEPIDGAVCMGDENESGDRALMRVLTDTYHIPVSDRRSRATFKLSFFWRRGRKGGIYTSEPFTLDSPENIQRSRLARTQDGGETRPLDPTPTTMANGAPIPAGTPPEILLELGELRAKQAGKPTAAVPAVGAQPADWEARLRLERDLVDAKAQAKAADDARAAAEKHSAEKAAMQKQIDDLRAAQEKAEIQRQLDDLKAAINKPAQVTDETRLAQVMLQQLQALGLVKVGPDGKPQAVGAGQPYQPPEVTPEQQIAAAAKVLADAETSKQKAREIVARAMGLEEPRTEIEKPEPEKPAEPSMMDKAMGMVGSALKGAMQNPEGPLSALAYIAKGSPLGEMAETAAKAVGAGRAAVSAHRATAAPPAAQGQPGWKPSA